MTGRAEQERNGESGASRGGSGLTRTCAAFALSAIAIAALLATAQPSAAQPSTLAAARPSAAKTIVLVHGAWADGSSWEKVIPLLQQKGFNVVAVQNPLSSLASDVDAATRAIDLQTGPVILVGHSWGGAVITQAGNNPKVAALVYVDAFGPDDNESVSDILKNYPPLPWLSTLIPDAGGFLTLSSEAVAKYFVPDLSPAEIKKVASLQGPVHASTLDAKVTKAAWRSKPSWYVLGSNDLIIPAPVQQMMAKRMGATITTITAGHVSPLSKPSDVAAVIVTAANKVK